MNYDIMTDQELLHYLDLYATDPLVLRLARMLGNTHSGLIADLAEAGMDPDTWQFSTDWGSMYPGEYIEDLRNALSHAESELNEVKSQLEDVVEERDELKTRSIMDFVEEVRQERRAAGHKVSEAMRESERYRKETEQYRKENEELKDKINVWKILETE